MNKEEEIQKKIESGKVGDTVDERAYAQVFRSLGKYEKQLSPSFADNVLLQIHLRHESKGTGMIWFLVVFAALAFMIALLFTLSSVTVKLDLGFLKAIKDFYGLFIFGVVFIVLINVIDRRLTRRTEAF